MKMAILPQSPPFTIALTWSTVHCIPVVTFPIGPFPGSGGCSSNWLVAYTHETFGSFPAAASFANWSEVNLFLLPTLLRYWNAYPPKFRQVKLLRSRLSGSDEEILEGSPVCGLSMNGESAANTIKWFGVDGPATSV